MQPLAKSGRILPLIRVTIFDNSEGEHCSSCEVGSSSREAIEFAIEHLKKRYGDEVQIEYLDLAEPQARRHHPEVVEQIVGQHIPLPLVAINGVPRLSGIFEYRMIVDAIETQREVISR